MTETDETAFQRMAPTGEGRTDLLTDLKNFDELTPEEGDREDVQSWELALSFDETDVPYLIEELEELVDGES